MEKLGIDVKVLVAQIINFAILFWVFKKFLFKPFFEIIDKEEARKKGEEKKLQELEKKEKELYEQKLAVEKEYEAKLKAFYQKMKKETDEAKKQIIKEASREAEEIRRNNLALIQAEKEKSLVEVKNEAYKIAMALSEQALSEVLTPDLQKEINADLINLLSKKKHELAN